MLIYSMHFFKFNKNPFFTCTLIQLHLIQTVVHEIFLDPWRSQSYCYGLQHNPHKQVKNQTNQYNIRMNVIQYTRFCTSMLLFGGKKSRNSTELLLIGSLQTCCIVIKALLSQHLSHFTNRTVCSLQILTGNKLAVISRLAFITKWFASIFSNFFPPFNSKWFSFSAHISYMVALVTH